MFEQSEEDVALGVLRIQLGDREYALRVLKMAQAPKWKRLFAEKLGRGLDDLNPATNEQVISEISKIASAVTLELVTAYDALGDGVLGSRRVLEENLTERQAFEILKAIVRVEFPFAEVAPLMAETIQPGLARALDRWISERFLSTATGPGETTPTPSSSVSAGASSTSSGARRRSAKRAPSATGSS